MSKMSEQPPPYGLHDKGPQQFQNMPMPYSQPPPPQHGFPAAEGTRPVPVTVQTHVISQAVPLNFGPDSQLITCRSCGVQGHTRVESKATTKTHIVALLLCCFLCWPCVCLPYCCASCQNRNHYCPNCNAFVGSYES